MTRLLLPLAAALTAAVLALAVLSPARAAAANPLCTAAGAASTAAGRVCSLLGDPGALLGAGKKLSKGDLLGTVKTLLGLGGSGGSTASTASTALGLSAIGVWVVGGAKFALHETAKVLSDSTTPQLSSTWFSGAYWRIAGIGAILTLPFLFAAALQALIRTDLSLLLRSALGYLPLALLAVSVAAPITMLLLSATDQMSTIAASAAGNAGAGFLSRSASVIGGLSALTKSPFMAFLVALFTAAGALVLWIELLMREAAVYVIVLMLPIVFAAFVWPARRVWVIRSLEVLVALVLSKFVIVAVLALGGAAMSHSLGHSVTGFLGGIVLLVMGAFAPWALLRLVPLVELASSAAGSLRSEARAIGRPLAFAEAGGRWAEERSGGDWPSSVTSGMRRALEELPSAAPFDHEGELAGQDTDPLEGAAGADRRAATSPGGDDAGAVGGDPGRDHTGAVGNGDDDASDRGGLAGAGLESEDSAAASRAGGATPASGTSATSATGPDAASGPADHPPPGAHPPAGAATPGTLGDRGGAGSNASGIGAPTEPSALPPDGAPTVRLGFHGDDLEPPWYPNGIWGDLPPGAAEPYGDEDPAPRGSALRGPAREHPDSEHPDEGPLPPAQEPPEGRL